MRNIPTKVHRHYSMIRLQKKHSQPNMATTVCTSAYTPTLITLDLAIPFVQNDYSTKTSALATF